MPVDDFNVSDFDLFRDAFLIEKSSPLDKNPAPRMTGEIEKMASEYNVKIAKRLNVLLNRLKRHVETNYKANTAPSYMGDFQEGGAAILNIHPKNTVFEKSIKMSVSIFDNNKMAIEVPEEISELLSMESRTVYKGVAALKNLKIDLRKIFRTISDH
tara:strand:+ start:2912 stop:3382 length:471 start_codon:yes stop_codon:yes gene_type:complete